MRKLLLLAAVAALAGCQAGSDAPGAGPGKEKAKTGGGPLGILKPKPVTVPEGTTLHLVMQTTLSSATAKAGDLVVAKLADDVVVGEKTVLPEGTELKGQVTAATPSGRVKGLAHLAFDFDRVVYKGKEQPIEAHAIDLTADNTHKRDAAIIGGGTAGGAVVGAVAGGKKGALIGSLIGAGAGTGVVLTNKGKEVVIPSGSQLGIRLTREARL